jgi:hypothetical protein
MRKDKTNAFAAALATAADPERPPATTAGEPVASAPAAGEPASRRGKRVVTFHVSPEVKELFRTLAYQHRRPIRSFHIEALNLILEKYGQPPIAE